jgi:nitroreductase
MSIDRHQIENALDWRYATKAYTDRKVSDEDWAALKRAIHYAPSSFGLQAYKVMVVEDSELRARLREAAFGQPQVTDASHLLVFTVRKDLSHDDTDRFIRRNMEVRGAPREALATLETMVDQVIDMQVSMDHVTDWNARQAYIALGFLLETAALLGIDASPMEGFLPAKFDEILGLTDHTTVVMAAVGYRNAASDWLAPLKKVRWREEDLFEVR